jgi:hypothetical protein
MDKKRFNEILTEEGIDDSKLRDDLWLTRPPADLDETEVRSAARRFNENLPGLLTRKALHKAIERELHH